MVVVVKKKRLIITAILIIVLVCTIVGISMGVKNGANHTMAKVERKIPVYAVDTDENIAAISFDAAWGSDKTLKILDVLDEYEVKATFFLVGFWIDEYPDLVKEIHERGHLIGNHSENHLHANSLSKEDIDEEITSVNKKISEIVGYSPKYFRPPFGEYNNTLIEVLESKQMVGVQWDVDSLDWKGLSGGQIADRIVPKVKKGSIILCHNNSDHIVEALPIVLMGLKNKGISLVRMDELVFTENYTVDNQGIQHLK